MLIGHQDLKGWMRNDGHDIRLGLLDHNNQILIRQEGLVVSLVCGYLKQLVETVKRGILHPFHDPTSLVLACTTQKKKKKKQLVTNLKPESYE